MTSAPLHLPLVVVAARLDAAMARRLSSFGIRRGAQLHLVRRLAGGGGVVAVAGSRVALERSLLESLTVAPAAV